MHLFFSCEGNLKNRDGFGRISKPHFFCGKETGFCIPKESRKGGENRRARRPAPSPPSTHPSRRMRRGNHVMRVVSRPGISWFDYRRNLPVPPEGCGALFGEIPKRGLPLWPFQGVRGKSESPGRLFLGRAGTVSFWRRKKKWFLKIPLFPPSRGKTP